MRARPIRSAVRSDVGGTGPSSARDRHAPVTSYGTPWPTRRRSRCGGGSIPSSSRSSGP
jgi:hypothetical protein